MWREAQWVLVGLFAPELVLYIAYRQAEVVRKLTPTVENLWRQVSRFEAKQLNGNKSFADA